MAKRPRNPLDRRADLLAMEMQRRERSIFSQLTDPSPAFMVHKNEIDQLRDYLRVKASPDGLLQLRGVYGDESVDQYVAWGEHALAKYLPQLMAREAMPFLADDQPEFTETPSFDDDDPPEEEAIGRTYSDDDLLTYGENLLGPA